MSKSGSNTNHSKEHTGHRERMRNRFKADKCSFFDFNPHEVLEMILYFSYKRCNTNEYAHRLIDRFGNIDKTLHAPTDELSEIPMIGNFTAENLHFLGQFLDRCDSDE